LPPGIVSGNSGTIPAAAGSGGFLTEARGFLAGPPEEFAGPGEVIAQDRQAEHDQDNSGSRNARQGEDRACREQQESTRNSQMAAHLTDQAATHGHCLEGLRHLGLQPADRGHRRLILQPRALQDVDFGPPAAPRNHNVQRQEQAE
jgi:hypothetical protein